MAYIDGKKVLFSPKINITGNGAGGYVILPVASRPETNINTNVFYRIDGDLHWYDGTKWYQIADTEHIPDGILTVDKIKEITLNNERCDSIKTTLDGIYIVSTDNSIVTDDNEEWSFTSYNTIPLLPGDNVEFEPVKGGSGGTVFKINATGGGSDSGSTSGGYFEGTATEYNEAADTVPVGAIVWLTDEEGNLTTAVLDKAILGQMILGTS